jgi:DNA-binding GntR family transcriptional regulator
MAGFDNLTLRERVHNHLKREILAHRYPPGSELLEVPLSRELGVSRGPIREALHGLEADGLVRITPRRGAVVISMTKRDFLEAYQVRESLETLGVRLAVPRLTDDELAGLDEQIELMDVHAASGDVDAFFEANGSFHASLVEASQNRKLIEVYHRLMAQMGPYRRPSARLRGNVEESIAEHRELALAARDRDVDRAVAIIMKHIEVPQHMIATMSDDEFARSAGLPRVGGDGQAR